MIISKIEGGLGNQLFQYAAARCLSVIKQTDLKLDITGFSTYQLRNFDLSQLNLEIIPASVEEIDAYKAEGRLKRIRSYLTPINKRHFYKQPYFHFDNQFFSLNNTVYLQGFFQSEKYFAPIKEDLRKVFTIKKEQLINIKEISKIVQSSNSVALHLRRGDYKNEATLRYHGILPIGYYQEAIALIQQQINNPHFYIFSDDSAWVKENLRIDNSTLISGTYTNSHYEDLHLMSKCRHNIIANSSFSWWGAWLNDHSDKIVIAPKRWFNEGPKDTQDLYPTGWLQL